MKSIIFVSIIVLTTMPLLYPQTQLLRIGNAAQYSYESNYEWIVLTTKSIEINGKEYFERKSYSPWYTQSVWITTWERIEGDSTYFILNTNGQDSLIFNFNWQIGKKYFTSTDGNIFGGQRIDSIIIANTFLIDDTVYVLKIFTYNTTTGDTNFNVLPEYNHLSKKIGKLNGGMWSYATGVKVNGTRYGEVYPFPEEVVFSVDSLYSEFIGDTVNCLISNNSDYTVVLDTIHTSSYYGYLTFLIKNNDYFYIPLYVQYPRDPGDSLNYIIPPHSSVQFLIVGIDLCPICDYEIQQYFQDTLRFAFSFSEGLVYSFDKAIPISGEGHMSDVKDDGSSPNEFVLENCFPNPFNPSTKISYEIPKQSKVLLKI